MMLQNNIKYTHKGKKSRNTNTLFSLDSIPTEILKWKKLIHTKVCIFHESNEYVTYLIKT